jgi:hypothetical protein
MNAFFGVMGTLSLFLCAVWLIVNLIKRKAKMRPITGMALGFAMIMIGAVIASPDPAVADPPEVEQLSPETPETPEPAPEPETSTETAAEIAYRLEITNISSELAKAFNGISKASQNYEMTNEWVFEMASHVGMVYAYIDEAYELQAPPKFSEVHTLYLQAMDKYKESMDKLTYGIDNLDAVEIEKANTLMAEGNEFMAEATRKMTELQ